ncbi:MAG: hypothetical protein CFE31_05995 [Rhizobiales bacterium PAR1]|nr:MAG: hypothetical protein CFE31_05995 [Rhizobiales bacterium PAR1]
MSTIKPLALYQIETFGAGNRHMPPRDAREMRQSDPVPDRKEAAKASRLAGPNRASEFLVQLMVDGDSDLRKVLGRQDIAERREMAYGAALANRPSAKPLSFLRVLNNA